MNLTEKCGLWTTEKVQKTCFHTDLSYFTAAITCSPVANTMPGPGTDTGTESAN